MFKVIEKKSFVILLVACYIVIFSGAAKAGGMGSKMGGTATYSNLLYNTSGMSSMGSMSKHTNDYTSYYNSADWYRTNSLLGYPGYNTYSPYSYNYGSSLLSPYSYNYGSPLNYNYANAYSGANPLSGLYNNYSWGNPYGTATSLVSGKNYTTEQSYTTYVPGGEVTTTIAEETETEIVPTSYGAYGLGNPYYGNLYGNTYYNNPYYGNTYYGYGYGSPYLW